MYGCSAAGSPPSPKAYYAYFLGLLAGTLDAGEEFQALVNY